MLDASIENINFVVGIFPGILSSNVTRAAVDLAVSIYLFLLFSTPLVSSSAVPRCMRFTCTCDRVLIFSSKLSTSRSSGIATIFCWPHTPSHKVLISQWDCRFETETEQGSSPEWKSHSIDLESFRNFSRKNSAKSKAPKITQGYTRSRLRARIGKSLVSVLQFIPSLLTVEGHFPNLCVYFPL